MITVSSLIKSLNYCCPWLFFQLFRHTTQIAERLGVSRRAVAKWKSRARRGEINCENCPRCQRAQLKRMKKRL